MKTTKLLLALGLALGTTAAFAQTTPAPASTTAPAASASMPAASPAASTTAAKPMHKHHRHHRRHRHHKAAKKVNDHDADDMNKTSTSTDANKGS